MSVNVYYPQPKEGIDPTKCVQCGTTENVKEGLCTSDECKRKNFEAYLKTLTVPQLLRLLGQIGKLSTQEPPVTTLVFPPQKGD